ncbi:MAG: hypothetical protein EBQ94_05970 [Flavobacteriales bacterium]|nr:hypothetical protein [Crocinitomicaceae bacterium]NBX79916.1 hypothetical protein [Flavobacteriales bacterium]
MNSITKNIVRYVLFTIIQALIFNRLEIGFGIHLMVHPLFIMLLPFEINVFVLMLLAFSMGAIIDVFSNTYGLYASSLLLMAYFRPIIFKFYSPREGYDPLKEPSIVDMGSRWFLLVFGYLLLIHHFWYFLIEIFRIDEFLFILQKTIFSLIASFLLCLLIQTFLIKKSSAK